ncbi:four-helix bundle copper-binding protein [Urbifossiella limnaea]|uniref:Four-helix bundle copper-binding protein n=1 Tax=Urbifossiella limnaea TaxID=2528023 RepID=A0A517XSH8_9BACT|nr:four-helix bundle copper-binding protein [Urbifossiella limnaea]QDU20458.1 hypothetical protein ETAA1_24100 [Urbifossiella limnaea]
MIRALFVGLVAAVLVANAGSPVASAQEGKKADRCCIECQACEKSCLGCAADCLNELAGGKADRKDCIKLCQDCADVCGACARIAARGGPLEATISAACAEACERCASECAKHRDDRTCLACAEQCRRCAAECRAQGRKK